jgi:hypothetical protein
MYVLSVFSGHMLHACLSGCCICFKHMLHMFYLDVVYGCNGFQALSGVFFKCFISMFQLPSDVYCNCCIWMFQK